MFLKVTASWFFPKVYVYLMQVLTKFYCPKLKTLVLAGFLRAILKLKKCDEVPEELHGVPAEEALMSRATMLGTSGVCAILLWLYTSMELLKRLYTSPESL
jgi:hypothetical protein